MRNPSGLLGRAAGYNPKELAVFVCDFGILGERRGPDLAAAPPCAGAFERRRRPLCGSEADGLDRRRLREGL